MSLWGAIPVLVVALLSGAGHPGLGQGDGRPGPVAVPPVSLAAHWAPVAAGQAPGVPSAALAMTSAVLAQIGAHTWQATVLLNNVGAACPVDNSSYVLETSRPDRAFQATQVVPVTSGGSPSRPVPCVAVTVTFSGVPRAPESAVLEFGAGGASPSSVQLTVSRNITLIAYLVVPVSAGAGMAIVMLLFLCRVRIYDWDGSRIAAFRYQERTGSPAGKKKIRPNAGFWQRTISATGAWTVNDSWATNIAAVVAVLATVLTTTSAANSLFPGVALDRFALVNLIAGAIVAAVPLAFGILYARWIDRFRGVTTDALIVPTMEFPDHCGVRLQGPATVTRRPRRGWRWLTQGRAMDLSEGDRIVLPRNGNRCIAAARGQHDLPEGTRITLLAGTVVTPAAESAEEWEAEHPRITLGALLKGVLAEGKAKPSRVRLGAALEVTLAERTHAHDGFSPWVRIPVGGKVTAGANAQVTQGLPARGQITLPEGAIAKLNQAAGSASVATVDRAAWEVTLLGGKETTAEFSPASGRAPSRIPITLPSGVRVTVCSPATAAVASPAEPAIVAVSVPAGAVLTVPGGAVIGPGEEPSRWSTVVKDGGKIQVPPQSIIRISTYPGDILALPGGSDLLVADECCFEITSYAGVLVVASDELAPQPTSGTTPDKQGQTKAPGGNGQPDANLEFPVRGIGPAGGKITVTGTAHITFPARMALTTPRRDDFTFRDDRRITIPQASGTLLASMWLVIMAALITMFGVGAEIGVAGTLAVLSDAATAWQWIIVGLITAIAAFTMYYAVTAVRALASPQPGSDLRQLVSRRSPGLRFP